MFKLKYQFIGVLIGIFITQYSTSGAEESFKSSKFLEYPEDAQRGYITSSMMMAGLIASQNNRTQAECIDDWGGKHRDSGYLPVIEAMKKYPDYHPSAVIISVLQRACGSFNYER